MKKHFSIAGFALTLTLAMTLASCSSKFEGYEDSETGYFFKFYTHSEDSATPNIGDYVFVKMVNIYKEDSVIYDSRKSKDDGIVSFAIQQPMFKGSLEEALMSMGKGDSASFKISADSIFAHIPSQDSAVKFPPNTYFTFEVKLVDVMTAEQMQQIQQEKYQAFMQKMEEMKVQRKAAEPGLIEKYLKDKNITQKPTPSGLYLVEKEKGSGPKPVVGSKVKVSYVGTFMEDGSVFDASENHGGSYEFTIGNNEVIKGWDEAFQMMHKGGKATLILPSSLAYDSVGSQDPYSGRYAILPYTPLIFDVELIDFK